MSKKATLTTLVAIAMMASSVIVVNTAMAQTATSTAAKWAKGRSLKGEFPGVFGTVSSIDGTSLLLTGQNGTSYTVNAADAKIRTGSSTSTVDISNIHVGDALIVKGTVSGATVSATNIIDGPKTAKAGATVKTGKHNGRRGIIGTVANVSGNTLSITAQKNNTVYAVDASSAKIFKGSATTTASLSDVLVGDRVSVRGTVSGTTITAKTIFDGIRSRK